MTNRANNPIIGYCRCPMWMGGSPAGLCGEPAYSEYIDGPEWWNAAQNKTMRVNRNYYSGYVSGFACPKHGGAKADGPRVFKDGLGKDSRGNTVDMWCAVWPEFENLQESPAAFHVVAEFAIRDLENMGPRL